MKGNKILVALITMAMLTSVFVIIERNNKALAFPPAETPGVEDWGLNDTTHKTLTYDAVGTTTAIIINTTGMTPSTYYYLYKPYYNYSGPNPSTFQWGSPIYDSELGWIRIQTAASPDGQTATFPAVRLDATGPWLVAKYQANPTSFPLPKTWSNFVWVNSSIDYTITDPGDDTTFGTNGTLPITINAGTDTHVMWDLYYNDAIVTNDKSSRFHQDYTTIDHIGLYGNITKGSSTGAGNYTLKAYRDLDGSPRYDWGTWGYNSTHGQGWVNTVTGYYYNMTGPWDPPEKNASDVTFLVKPGTPTVSLATSTVYWNFSGDLNISLKYPDGTKIPYTGIERYHYRIFNGADELVAADDGYGIGNHSLKVNKTTGWLNITSQSWGKNCTWYNETGSDPGWHWGDNSTVWGANGTWKVYIWVDRNGDRTETNKDWTEEYNATVSFTVDGAPSAQFKWIDDDGSLWSDKNTDGVIPYVPSISNVPLYIKFQIIGNDHTYFGASNEDEAKENITLTGNALFTGTLDKIPGADYSGGTWTVPIIPTMGASGGTINIAATWKTTSKNYGTLEGTLSIGGTNYMTNGTIVTLDSNEARIGTPATFTVTVKDADGVSTNKYATAYLYYIGDNDGGTVGKPIVNGHLSIDTAITDGIYTLGLNTTQQRANQTGAGNGHANFGSILAPRNLTVYVVAPVGTTTTYGYALVRLKPQAALKVNAEVRGALSTVMAAYKYARFYVNTTLATTGNTTTYPDSDDETSLKVRFIDENGHDVTNSLGTRWSTFATEIAGDYTKSLTDAYFTRAGTYTVYAYNDTATSEGNNGTFIVKKVSVTSDVSPFIWKHDDNVSATFTVLYGGDKVNGTLRIDNITEISSKYNRTYTNTSFDGSTDQGGNTSKTVTVTNGIITVNDITADFLPSGVAEKNITFWFKPTGSTVYAKAEGIVKVSVPTVTVQDGKSKIPLGKTTTFYIQVTGRGTPLSGVFVRIHGQGVDQNGTSDSEGKVTFSALPTTTGNISIDVGQSGRTVTTKILVTYWTFTITTDAQVDETKTFVVTVVKEGTTTPVVGADVTFNTVTLTTGTDGKTQAFTAPSVSSDRTYTITVTAEGFIEGSTTITVINVPTLIISVDATVTGGSTFEIAVAKDTGDPVIGATVTFNGGTYKTKAGGVVTLTAPTTAGDYEITAEFGTFTGATATVTVTAGGGGGIPGFELVTLVIAIGVALILLRRRRN